MESLLKLQLMYKNIIEKGRVNFKKSPKERITRSYLETRLEQLEAQWGSFVETHRKIFERVTDADKQGSYFTTDVYDKTEEIYISYKSELKEYLASSGKKLSETQCPNSSNYNVKLPKIIIPTFSGKYSEWASFRDLFLSLIHKNDAIDDVQKLHYLKGHLTGEAEQLLRYTPVTASNYKECWSTLNKRYDNKRFLSNSMLKRFINQPNIVTESSIAIKELLDTTVDCLHGLQTLGVNVSTWDAIVIYITSSKLDSESRKIWESNISTSDQLPTFQEFQEFLESRFRALEFLGTKQTRQKFTVSKPKILHATTSEQNQNNIICSFCNGSHKISYCKLFSREDINKRRDFIQNKGLCFNCLGANHSIKFCKVKTSCQICHRRHHSLLHFKSSANATLPGASPDTAVASNSALSTLHTATDTTQEAMLSNHLHNKTVSNQVLLATALVEAGTAHGYRQLLRALLDQGSQASFITESAVQLLGLKKLPSQGFISGIGGDGSTLTSRFIVHVDMYSRHDPSFHMVVKAHVLGKITSLLPSDKVILTTWPELENMTLADPKYQTPSKIDILLGAEVYGQIIKEGLIRKVQSSGSIIAQNSTLGWILSGQVPTLSSHCHNAVISMHSQTTSDNDILKKFWEIESDIFSIKKRFTEEEERCEEFFSQTTTRDPFGRYVVRLPFRDLDLPKQTRDIALKRFHLLENRFKKDPALKIRYTEVIQEYLDLGHMVIVPKETDFHREQAVYLPHHPVIREDKLTTKIRVVFDASAKSANGISLNDKLMVGPTIQPELRHLILKWRMHPIVLCADIVKMYRQVAVASDDTDFQRIVWRSDPASETKDYKLVRVTFGTASAPYLAVKSLQQLAHDEGDQFPLASEKVKNEFYVDDLMSGCETLEEGIRLYEQMNELLEKGGFQLQKWMTNNKELEIKIAGDNTIENRTLQIKIDDVVKILGLSWNRDTDTFTYSVAYPRLHETVTKRKVISEISRLFDPLGWAAPCIITAKIMIQKIWLAGIDWDEELPIELKNEWENYRKNLEDTHQFVVPRWLNTCKNDIHIELHGFCDSSSMAYAAVIYLRVIDTKRNIKVNLVTAKTKVAPTKQLSIPRLELMGAFLLAKLITEVAEVLTVAKENIHCWTDSTVVLAWLSNHPSHWTTFVGNRTSDILTHVENTQWAHVTSTHNPADIASRGMTPLELSQSSLWKYGPTWLQKDHVNYVRPKSISTNAELKPTKKMKVYVTACDDTFPLWTKYSSLQKLLRVVAYCRRFLRPKQFKEIYLNSEELADALELCIKYFQEQEFKEDIINIKRKININKKSKLKSLYPILDDRCILRMGGRIHNAQLSEEMKHPIILPQHCQLTDLIVAEAHKETLHGGPTIMLNYLRSNYWIISARSVIKAYVRKCVVCTRYAANFKNQLMGQLPSCRVTPSRAFLQSGVDFAGPISIRVSKGRGNKSYKGYICLYVCMATKAVHLEAISDLTSEGFIAGFRRFVARRGHCSDIWSDNGSNFVGASKELASLVVTENSSVASEIQSWLSTKGVTWHFIPPHAPNFRGLWEAGIKSTKFHLKRVIGTSTLTYEEMSTLLTQIEACLNSRPLSQVVENPYDPIPLTPGHFLIGEPLLLVPSRDFVDSSISSLNRWQLLQRMTKIFWSRWQQEYLAHLMERYKWSKLIKEPNIGDIVLVKEDNLPPGRWLLGKIVAKHPGLDGITRVVSLKCNDSEIKRPTSKLCILPISN